ncbi:FecR domain-containing protein [Porticoccaceae bacterium LTM1]|nr:FecR domain-containing protein [Porticoccaceae bacterium LTM1]
MSSKEMDRIKNDAAVELIGMLDGSLMTHDGKAQSSWSDKSPEYRREFLQASHTLADIDCLKDSSVIQNLLELAESGGTQKYRKFNHWKGFSMAAGILIAVFAGLLLWQGNQVTPNGKIDRYVTRIGEQNQLTLADGSTVYLNTGTELLVEMNEDARKLTLRRGEAYFDVVKQADAPFSVEVGGRTIVVLGTTFSVRVMPDRTLLDVSEGEVALIRSDEPLASYGLQDIAEGELVMAAGNQYRIGAGWSANLDVANASMSAMRVDISRVADWRDGVLSFEGVPLVDVVQELNRYSAKKIMIMDSEVMGLEVTAGIPVSRISQALSGLSKVLPIQIESDFDQVFISSKAD